MKYTALQDYSKVNGTSLKGYVDVSYATLIEMFGEPLEGDGYKTDAEWVIAFKRNGGTVYATIYNYKDGRNYCGEEGLDVEDITDWHIGGTTQLAETYVHMAVEEFLAKEQA